MRQSLPTLLVAIYFTALPACPRAEARDKLHVVDTAGVAKSALVGQRLFVTPNSEGRLAGDPTVCDSCRAGEVHCDQTLMGELRSDDCSLDDGSFVDAYELRIEEESIVRIRLTAEALDSFLFLVDESCVILALNDNCEDDDGDGQHACLERTLLPGTYYIAANSRLPAEGDYSLTVSCIETRKVPSLSPRAATVLLLALFLAARRAWKPAAQS